jgi:hypothetical protein
MAAKCLAIARSGSRCNSPTLPESSYCWMHSPDAAEARREAARKGGRNRATKVRAAKQLPEAMTAEDLTSWLSLLFTSVMAGKVEARIGNACAAIARTLLEAQTAAAQPSIAELEEQLAVLRAMVERSGGGRAA